MSSFELWPYANRADRIHYTEGANSDFIDLVRDASEEILATFSLTKQQELAGVGLFGSTLHSLTGLRAEIPLHPAI